MDLIVIVGGLFAVALVVGVPVYLVFFGMAGRSWRDIKDHDKWKRNQKSSFQNALSRPPATDAAPTVNA